MSHHHSRRDSGLPEMLDQLLASVLATFDLVVLTVLLDLLKTDVDHDVERKGC